MAIPAKRWGRRLALLPLVIAGAATLAANFPYNLVGPGPSSNSGTHIISLPPLITVPTIGDCSDLLAFIPNAISLARLDPQSNDFVPCTCPAPSCFPIVPGEAYQVQVSADSNFTIVGDDGAVLIPLLGPESSLSGVNLISLPFGSPLADADALGNDIGGFVSGGGPVVNLQRFLTLSDTFEVYTGNPRSGTNFSITAGEGYIVTAAGDIDYSADFCESPTSCFFKGLETTALGNALLSLDAQGNLQVDNIGLSGSDGFRVLPESGGGAHPETGHEEWVELGFIKLGTINTPIQTSDGASINSLAHATLSGGQIDVDISFVDIGSELRVSTNIGSATNASNLRFEVFGDTPGVVEPGIPDLNATVRVGDWPRAHSFSRITWASNVSIVIETTSGDTVLSGDELHIVPVSPTRVLDDSGELETTGRSRGGGLAPAGTTDLTGLTVEDSSFNGECGDNIVSIGEDCDDGNRVSGDCCSAICLFENSDVACEDGDACTENDSCDGSGTCNAGGATTCNDLNFCTTDTCDSGSGCVFTNNTMPCVDGNVCTVGDTCGGGVCNPGSPLNCGDGNVCTDDDCDPGIGCRHSNNLAPCNDGEICTDGDSCLAGNCLPGGPLDCNDGDPCTNDVCIDGTGCVNAGTCDDVPSLSDTGLFGLILLMMAGGAWLLMRSRLP